MINLYEQLQTGTISANSFMFQEKTRRLFKLEMSNRRDVERVHTGGVNTIDIEGIENRYLLSGDNHGNIHIHDLFQFTKRLTSTSKSICRVDRSSRHTHTLGVDTVQWYPFDTGAFTSSSMDESLKVWDTSTLKPVDTMRMRGKVYCHHQSPIAMHNLIAVAMTYPNVVLVDMKSGSSCHELSGHRGKILSVRWSPNAEHILVSGGSDNKILLWDVRSAKGFLRALDQHNGEAIGSRKDAVTAHNGMVNGLCFSSDGMYLLSFGTDARMLLWDVASGKNTLVNYGSIPNMSQKHVQIDLCYDACVPVVFVPSKSRIKTYNMFSGMRVSNLIGHFTDVKCCSYRSYFHELYSGGYDRSIVFWTPDVQRELIADGASSNSQDDNWSD